MKSRSGKNTAAVNEMIDQERISQQSLTDTSSMDERRVSLLRLGIIVGSALVVALAIALRVMVIGREPVNSDEATVALMAHEILHGHTFTFYWGQNYGGVEPYIVAAAFFIFGQTSMVLGLVPVFLDFVAAFLLYRIGKRLFKPNIALGASLLFLIWPEVYIWQSTLEYGFRYIALDIGLAMVLLVIKIIEDTSKITLPETALEGEHIASTEVSDTDPGENKESTGSTLWGKLTDKKVRQALLLGLLTGLGWWSTPEIVYFVFPLAILIIYSLVRKKFKVSFLQLAVLVPGLIIGALPWLYDNVGKGFPSLHSGPQQDPSFSDHFRLFFTHVLPMVLGLRLIVSGNWLGGENLGLALYALVILLGFGYFLYSIKKRKNFFLILFLLIFPFPYAYSPFSWYWQDGRYAIYLAPFLSLYLIAAFERVTAFIVSYIEKRRDNEGAVSGHSRDTAILTSDESAVKVHGGKYLKSLPAVSPAILVVIGLVLTMLAATQVTPFTPSKYAANRSSWLSFGSNSDNWLTPAVDTLEKHHLTYAYAGYWIAYALAFASDENVIATSPVFYRYYQYAYDVYGANPVAWIFPNPNRLTYVETETSTNLVYIGCIGATRSKPVPIVGYSGCLTLGEMESYLRTIHDKFQVLTMGDLVAVVPQNRVNVFTLLEAEKINA